MNLLAQAAIFLGTAVIVVPLFRRMQLGAVLGYLAAGAIIGPWGLGLIADADATLNFAEMGVVLLLFLIGLELEPSRLWALRQPVFGLGGAQVVVTGIALTGIALWLNLSWQAAIAFVIVVSRLLVRPALKLIARFGGREVFTAAALLVVIGAALTMELMGLSMSLGAFLAGVLLADSEFRHELEADVEPFKGLLLGLFFMAVGMSANLALFVSHPFTVLGAVLGLMVLKALLMYGLARVSGTGGEEAQRIAVLIAQGGEFAFVLFVAAQTACNLPGETVEFLVLVVTVCMLLAPLSFIVQERLLERWLERTKAPEFDLIEGHGNPVIIAGYG